MLLAERLASDAALHGQAFNFSNEIQVSVLELVELILRKMKSSLRPEVLNQASNEIRHQFLSAERARTVLNWRRSSRLSLALIAPSPGIANFWTRRPRWPMPAGDNSIMSMSKTRQPTPRRSPRDLSGNTTRPRWLRRRSCPARAACPFLAKFSTAPSLNCWSKLRSTHGSPLAALPPSSNANSLPSWECAAPRSSTPDLRPTSPPFRASLLRRWAIASCGRRRSHHSRRWISYNRQSDHSERTGSGLCRRSASDLQR